MGYATVAAQMAPTAGVTSRCSGRRGKGMSARSAVGSFAKAKSNRCARRAGGVSLAATAELEDGQMVTIHYVMKFPDGEVADDTRKRNVGAVCKLPLR
jgi:FKBP-type peptidyl-prolyl cis-trans isomerase